MNYRFANWIQFELFQFKNRFMESDKVLTKDK